MNERVERRKGWVEIGEQMGLGARNFPVGIEVCDAMSRVGVFSGFVSVDRVRTHMVQVSCKQHFFNH